MIRHVASIAEIVEDLEAAIGFYRQVLDLPVKHEPGSGYALVQVDGTLHFGLWERKAAAKATFGDATAADRIPLGFSIGFEVDSVDAAAETVQARRWPIAQPRKTEPWGQTTSRFYSPSGALCEFSEMPNSRRITQRMRAEEDGA